MAQSRMFACMQRQLDNFLARRNDGKLKLLPPSLTTVFYPFCLDISRTLIIPLRNLLIYPSRWKTALSFTFFSSNASDRALVPLQCASVSRGMYDAFKLRSALAEEISRSVTYVRASFSCSSKYLLVNWLHYVLIITIGSPIFIKEFQWRWKIR